MESITRIYRIPLSLSIAIARLREILPAVHVPPEGWGGPAQAVVAAFATDVTAVMFSARVYGPDNERAHIVWQADMVTARCGAWQVTARRDRATWTHAGTVVTVMRAGASAAGGSDARLARAMRVVERRAAQLAGALAAFDWRMTCDVAATGADEVLAVLRAYDCPGALAQVERTTVALWPTARYDCYEQAVFRLEAHLARRAKLVELLRGQEGEPTDPWLRTWLAQDELNQHLLDMLKDPSMPYERIAESLYVSVDTVQRVAKGLQERGYIPRRKRGRKRGL